MRNTQTEEKILEAMLKQEPKSPQRCELGGGIYYKCHWLKCNTDVNRFMNYCPGCGQCIDWSEL